jgi:hypothetical protein
MSRVFLMKWYHFSVEHFEDLRNVNHCEFLIMRQNDNGRYMLENKLRTWSELKLEHAQELVKEKGEDTKDGKDGKSQDVSTLARAATVEVRRRWGGCPNGCNHDKSFKIRQTLADLVKSDSIISNHAAGVAVSESGASNVSGGSASTVVPNGAGTHGITNPSFNGTANSQTLVSRRPAAKRFQSQTTDETGDSPQFTITGPQIDVTKSRDEVVSSPDGTPSFISVDDRLRSRLKSPNVPPRPQEPTQLHVGRDFGGTYSGHNSAASDDADSSSEEDSTRRRGAAIAPASPALTITSASTSTTTTTNTSASTTGSSTPTPNGNTSSTSQTPTPVPRKSLGVPASAIPHHHRPHNHREQSRMGRGTRANRLGDHHSSDGEHEADCERDPCGTCEADEESGSEVAKEEEEEGGGSEVVSQELADEADEVMSCAEREETEEVLRRMEALSQAEREERSVMGSVY